MNTPALNVARLASPELERAINAQATQEGLTFILAGKRVDRRRPARLPRRTCQAGGPDQSKGKA